MKEKKILFWSMTCLMLLLGVLWGASIRMNESLPHLSDVFFLVSVAVAFVVHVALEVGLKTTSPFKSGGSLFYVGVMVFAAGIFNLEIWAIALASFCFFANIVAEYLKK